METRHKFDFDVAEDGKVILLLAVKDRILALPTKETAGE